MQFEPALNEELIINGGIGVRSECGKLMTVLMHRPGKELLRLTEENLAELLFDAIPNINETHRSHDIFAQYLRDQDVHVLYVEDLLRETLLSSEQARRALISGIIANCTLKENHGEQFLNALRQWLLTRKSRQLVADVIAGVVHSPTELGSSTAAQSLLNMSSFNGKFIVPPLPNLVFTRDSFSIIEKKVFIWHMAKPARRNEPLIMRTIFQYHPQLSTLGLQIVDWQALTTSNNLEPATIEGGDVAYLGEDVLLIGHSERTNCAGIEGLVRTGLFRQLIAITLPPQRDYMHLDTVLSSVGRHAFTLHGRLANIMEVFTVHISQADKDIQSKVEWISYGCDVRQALATLLNGDLKFYDAEDEETSVNEQRDCRHNVVVIDDCHVMTYAGGDLTKGIVRQMMRHEECRVELVPTKGLLEGGGGMHCMTNAIGRRAK